MTAVEVERADMIRQQGRKARYKGHATPAGTVTKCFSQAFFLIRFLAEILKYLPACDSLQSILKVPGEIHTKKQLLINAIGGRWHWESSRVGRFAGFLYSVLPQPRLEE